MAELSPMMRQYNEINAQNEDTILFFRVGDFYEMFFEDAKKASEELDLVLTGKECGLEERAPMCGVPFHSCEAYIARLVEQGYKVAICEQVEDPATAKGLVKRDIVRRITPGTVLEDSMLDEGRNNYLAAICMGEGEIGLCFTDASTGECHATALSEENFQTRLIDEIARFSPREILIGEDFNLTAPTVWDYLQQSFEGMLTVREKTSFNLTYTEELILKHFNVISVENIGLQKNGAATAAFGATLQYLYETGVNGQISVNEVDLYTGSQFMKLDTTAVRNLELCETMRLKAKKGSLLWVLDKTKTAMGKRLIRNWVSQPLLSISAIELRQNAVDELVSNTILRGEIVEGLSGVRDIERLMTKVVYGSANAKDLLNLSFTAQKFPVLKGLLSNANCRMLKEICNEIDNLEDIAALINEAINPEAPTSVR